MALQVDAIYENGVFRPLGHLNLEDHQRVSLTVSEPVPASIEDWLDHEYMAAINSTGEEEPSLEQVWSATSRIKGSLSGAVRAERDHRG